VKGPGRYNTAAVSVNLLPVTTPVVLKRWNVTRTWNVCRFGLRRLSRDNFMNIP